MKCATRTGQLVRGEDTRADRERWRQEIGPDGTMDPGPKLKLEATWGAREKIHLPAGNQALPSSPHGTAPSGRYDRGWSALRPATIPTQVSPSEDGGIVAWAAANGRVALVTSWDADRRHRRPNAPRVSPAVRTRSSLFQTESTRHTTVRQFVFHGPIGINDGRNRMVSRL